mmetsp:Transcript_20308/g.42442  ORF Transcript_20308/g.42442 Transcript_20308/m.42442 type:complete len:205 (-) Transcript_20308:1634-2248(-)
MHLILKCLGIAQVLCDLLIEVVAPDSRAGSGLHVAKSGIDSAIDLKNTDFHVFDLLGIFLEVEGQNTIDTSSSSCWCSGITNQGGGFASSRVAVADHHQALPHFSLPQQLPHGWIQTAVLWQRIIHLRRNPGTLHGPQIALQPLLAPGHRQRWRRAVDVVCHSHIALLAESHSLRLRAKFIRWQTLLDFLLAGLFFFQAVITIQ